ncbi:MAG: hypothetical protein K2X97_07475 [Mycobacteriaceae bacterium]|nr:hypothetical protein [Mycobacteriaceae bacterium]
MTFASYPSARARHALTSVFPASACWTQAFVCRGGYELAYRTSRYTQSSNRTSTSVHFHQGRFHSGLTGAARSHAEILARLAIPGQHTLAHGVAPRVA